MSSIMDVILSARDAEDARKRKEKAERKYLNSSYKTYKKKEDGYLSASAEYNEAEKKLSNAIDSYKSECDNIKDEVKNDDEFIIAESDEYIEEEDNEEPEEAPTKNFFVKAWRAIKKVAKKVWKFIKNVGYWICPWHWFKKRKKVEEEDEGDDNFEDFFNLNVEDDDDDDDEEEVPNHYCDVNDMPVDVDDAEIVEDVEPIDDKTVEAVEAIAEAVSVEETPKVTEEAPAEAEVSDEDNKDEDEDEDYDPILLEIQKNFDDQKVQLFLDKDSNFMEREGANIVLKTVCTIALASQFDKVQENLDKYFETVEVSEETGARRYRSDNLKNVIFELTGDKDSKVLHTVGVVTRNSIPENALQIIGLRARDFDSTQKKNGATMFADTKSGSAVAVSFKKVKGKKGAGHPAVFFDFINVAFEE